MQLKTLRVFGPLSKVWIAIEEAENAERKDAKIPSKDLTSSLKKSVILLEQAIDLMKYQRCFDALSAVMNQTRKAKSRMK